MQRVFLLDPMLATGGSASMAIQQIVKSGVSPDKITFINLVSCEEGILRI
jgi:uracil phosphoribosyltransferase